MRENDKEGFRGALLALHVFLAVFGCHLLVCSLVVVFFLAESFVVVQRS